MRWLVLVCPWLQVERLQVLVDAVEGVDAEEVRMVRCSGGTSCKNSMQLPHCLLLHAGAALLVHRSSA
jgi:hypothetical protein